MKEKNVQGKTQSVVNTIKEHKRKNNGYVVIIKISRGPGGSMS
jgi:hypothetical protein